MCLVWSGSSQETTFAGTATVCLRPVRFWLMVNGSAVGLESSGSVYSSSELPESENRVPSPLSPFGAQAAKAPSRPMFVIGLFA